VNEAELRASRARIVAASHAARRRIERNLHDGPQQHLVALAVKLRLAEAAIDDDPASAKAQLVEMRTDVQDTIQHLRDLAHELYPPLLADRGLPEALRSAAARAPFLVDVTAVPEDGRRFVAEVEAAVYFCVLAAIQGADGPLTVAVTETTTHLRIDLEGDLAEGPALLEIADRVDTLAGDLDVTSRRDGVRIVAAIPVG
jgi:signal transduction histidine kinase